MLTNHIRFSRRATFWLRRPLLWSGRRLSSAALPPLGLSAVSPPDARFARGDDSAPDASPRPSGMRLFSSPVPRRRSRVDAPSPGRKRQTNLGFSALIRFSGRHAFSQLFAFSSIVNYRTLLPGPIECIDSLFGCLWSTRTRINLGCQGHSRRQDTASVLKEIPGRRRTD